MADSPQDPEVTPQTQNNAVWQPLTPQGGQLPPAIMQAIASLGQEVAPRPTPLAQLQPPAPMSPFVQRAGQMMGGKQMAYNGPLSPDERFVISREDASMDPNAYNSVLVPGMGHAFGIGQLTDVIRQQQAKKYGLNPNTVDPAQQIEMMRGYIADRYGNAANAAQHERRFGWY